MADLTITVADVLAGVNAGLARGTAGQTITAGQTLYLTAGALSLASADSVAASRCVGIALHDALVGQPVVYCTRGEIDVGATLTIGETYAVSSTDGGIAPIADLVTSKVITTLGTATAANVLVLAIAITGATRA